MNEKLNLFDHQVDEIFERKEIFDNHIEDLCAQLKEIGLDTPNKVYEASDLHIKSFARLIKHSFERPEKLMSEPPIEVSIEIENYIEELYELVEKYIENYKSGSLAFSWEETENALDCFSSLSENFQETIEINNENPIAKKDFLQFMEIYGSGVGHLIQAIKLNYGSNRFDHIKQVGYAKRGGKASSKRWDKAKNLAVEIAKDQWDSSENDQRIGAVANSILRVIKADPENLGIIKPPTFQTIKDWISDLAPEQARKPGRPKKV